MSPEVLHVAAVPMPLNAAWERLLAAPAEASGAPGRVTSFQMTKGEWAEPDAEGVLEFRTPDKTTTRAPFVVRDHLPGARIRLQFTSGALNGAVLDIALNEADENESVAVASVGHLSGSGKRAKDSRGKPLPTPRERRAAAALAAFLEATLLPPQPLAETS